MSANTILPYRRLFRARLFASRCVLAVAVVAFIGLGAGCALPAAAQGGPEGPRGQQPRTIQVAQAQGGEQASAPASDNAAPANVGNPAPAKGPQPRIAVVIGNSKYEHVTPLANPQNDAQEVARLLSSAGFEVIAGTDLTREEMLQVMQDFIARIAERGPDTVALVYYAGHGLQIAGENYLVPIDAQLTGETDVSEKTVRLVDVMSALNSVTSRTRLVILDACRNNPFNALGDAGKGLAIVDAPNGSIVAYSTAPGTEAFDGSARHSPYTSAFLKLARTPNLPIEQFFKRVRLLVNDATDGRQTPWESSSLTSDFTFFTDIPVLAQDDEKPYVKPKPKYQVAELRTRSVREAYDIVIEEDAVEYYEEFVEVYPNDPLALRIRALLASRLMMVAWHNALKVNSPVAYQTFQNKFAHTVYANQAAKLQVKPKIVPVNMPVQVFKPVRVLPNAQISPKPIVLPKPVITPKPIVTPKVLPVVAPAVNVKPVDPKQKVNPILTPAKPNPLVTTQPAKPVVSPPPKVTSLPPKVIVVAPPKKPIVVNKPARVRTQPGFVSRAQVRRQTSAGQRKVAPKCSFINGRRICR